MDEMLVITLARETLTTTLLIAGPVLAVSLVVGIVVSLVQVATSVQDITLTFVPKMVAVGIAVLLGFTWALHLLVGFAGRLIGGIPTLLR